MKRLLIGTLATAALSGSALAHSHGAVTFEDHLKPVLAQHCFMCHGPYSPGIDRFDEDKSGYSAMLVGPRMYAYDELMEFVTGGDAGALMRRLDDGSHTSDGQPGNMYEYLGETEEERAENLKLFKRWVGHWTLKRSAEMTDEDHKLIRALERR